MVGVRARFRLGVIFEKRVADGGSLIVGPPAVAVWDFCLTHVMNFFKKAENQAKNGCKWLIAGGLFVPAAAWDKLGHGTRFSRPTGA